MDDHNNLRHQVPAIEEVWGTHRWANRVFAFLLAVTEVNCYLAFRYFVWKGEDKMTLQEFRGKLGWALIDNDYLSSDTTGSVEERKKRKVVDHQLERAPTFAKRFECGQWDLTCKSEYQQYLCRTPKCKNRVRTYCACNVGSWLCKSCFVDHIQDSSF